METNKNKISIILYISEVMFIAGWLVYLEKFYQMYSETYFFVNEKLSLLQQNIFMINSYFKQIMIFFVGAFILVSISFFIIASLYIFQHQIKKTGLFLFILVVNLGLLIPIFVNVLGVMLFIVTLLAATIVYSSYVFTDTKFSKQESTLYESDFEIDEIIQTFGPFADKNDAETQIDRLFKTQDMTVHTYKYVIDKEVYIGDDEKYYIDYYVVSKKNGVLLDYKGES